MLQQEVRKIVYKPLTNQVVFRPTISKTLHRLPDVPTAAIDFADRRIMFPLADQTRR